MLAFVPQAHASNTSLRAATFNFDDFQFASDSFVSAGTVLINTTDPTVNFTIFTSFNALRLSGGGVSVIGGRILIDGVEIVNEDLRTLDSLNEEGSAGFKPINSSVSAGEHNLTLEFRRSGVGTIEINDMDMVIIRPTTQDNGSVRFEMNNLNFSHSAADFIASFNWTMNKTRESHTYISSVMRVSKETGGSSTLTYFQSEEVTSDRSPFIQRVLSSATDLGSLAIMYVDHIESSVHNHSIFARQTDVGDTIRVNGSIIDIDLVDNESRIISSFQDSNNRTNTTLTVTYTAGISNVANVTTNISNGSSYFLSMFNVFQSASGQQTVSYFVNSSNVTQGSCFSKKERFLPNNNDIGEVFLYTSCDGNFTTGDLITFNIFINVSSGESITQLDESFSGFEFSSFDVSALTITPTDEELVIGCLRDGNCDGWFIADELDDEGLMLLIIYFAMFGLALICDRDGKEE